MNCRKPERLRALNQAHSADFEYRRAAKKCLVNGLRNIYFSCPQFGGGFKRWQDRLDLKIPFSRPQFGGGFQLRVAEMMEPKHLSRPKFWGGFKHRRIAMPRSLHFIRHDFAGGFKQEIKWASGRDDFSRLDCSRGFKFDVCSHLPITHYSRLNFASGFKANDKYFTHLIARRKSNSRCGFLQASPPKPRIFSSPTPQRMGDSLY